MKPKIAKRVVIDPLDRKITFASVKEVNKLKPWIKMILVALGHPKAFVRINSPSFL